MSIRDLLAEKREDILRIAADHGAHNVRVFGSVARGEERPDSDVDLLVDFQAGTSLLQHAALMLALEQMLGCKVDIASSRGLKERYRSTILDEARSL